MAKSDIEALNTNHVPCKNGHTGQWTEAENGKSGKTRRCRQCGRDVARRGVYGISAEAYEQLKEEYPTCAICGSDGSDCGFGSLEIDHDHNTGEIRGLLCRKCNIFLGHYEKRKHTLDAVKRYLNEP